MSFGIVSRSETTDFIYYLDLDSDCSANKSPFFRELFPTSPHYVTNEQRPDGSWETVYLEAYYYYCKRPAMDYTYDIYAQWPLEQEEFDKEIARVRDLFETRDYEVVRKGNYTCFFYYDYGDPPFEQVTDSYSYYIFAYDEANSIVRYITCVSLEDGADQPYYLKLEW